MTKVDAGFQAIGSAQAKILILGSMPGVASLQAQAYYAHPRNAFWRILETVYEAKANSSYEQRCKLLEQNHIMVWDVIARAARKGSLDSAIEAATITVNDFSFLQQPNCEISTVLCNGAKAFDLFKRQVVKKMETKQTVHLLPSTSPANAATSFDKKLLAWQTALALGIK